MIRLAVRVRSADAETALAELLRLAPSGVEEVDLGDRVEYAVYGAEGELPSLPDLKAAAGEALVEVVTTEVADDWAQAWRDFHRPVDVGRSLHVRAPWHPDPSGERIDLVIDPGQAFGTGAHHTTRLCLELLEGLEPAGAALDVGCGSGVLAIAAAQLGWTPVRGLDFERESVEATRTNAAANGVEVDAVRHDLVRDGPVPGLGEPLVLANLLRPLLLALSEGALPREHTPQHLIASGLLREEADEIAQAFAASHGLREADRREAGEWSALLLAS